jgi:hypothetical protein
VFLDKLGADEIVTGTTINHKSGGLTVDRTIQLDESYWWLIEERI